MVTWDDNEGYGARTPDEEALDHLDMIEGARKPPEPTVLHAPVRIVHPASGAVMLEVSTEELPDEPDGTLLRLFNAAGVCVVELGADAWGGFGHVQVNNREGRMIAALYDGGGDGGSVALAEPDPGNEELSETRVAFFAGDGGGVILKLAPLRHRT